MRSYTKPSALVQKFAGRKPVIVGHRGYCEVAPENTLPSFQQALEAGAEVIELDYRLSRDGVAVVLHDDTLDRTTDARKRWRRRGVQVADTSAADIRTLDAGSWFDPRFRGTRVPLLTEALELIVGGGATALIERKAGGATSCAELLRAVGLVDRVVVIAFDWAYLREFHEIEPGQLLGALGPPSHVADGRKRRRLTKTLDAKWIEELSKTGAGIVVWNRQVTKAAIDLAHERGMLVWVYTVNEPGLARRLLGFGVDGIITNRIRLIRRALSRAESDQD